MKSLLFLLSSIVVAFPHFVFACKCNFEHLNKLLKDPTTANSAFIAVYKSGSFEVRKNWKPVPSSKFKIESSWPGHKTTCDLDLVSGQEYLIISIAKTKEPFSLSLCTAKVVKVSEAQEIISKLEKSTKK